MTGVERRPPEGAAGQNSLTPSLSLPTGGGAIRGMGETFSAGSATGTGGMSIPVAVSPTRSGLGPQLALGYDSAGGNGPYGFGWGLDVPSVTRRTDTGIPRYADPDAAEPVTDVFRLSGADDLVRTRDATGTPHPDATVAGHTVRRFRPRTEGAFTRIERWTRNSDGDVHWRTLTTANVLSVYGGTDASRVRDPQDPRRVFSWLLCETRDDSGNGVLFEYKREDAAGVDLTAPHESGRGTPARRAQRYLKRIRYGNRTPLLDADGRRPVVVAPDALNAAGWMFEVVLDYGEHAPDAPVPADPDPGGTGWPVRDDPFSSYRSGFEIRTYRLCRRLLMFHHFPDEAGVGADCLVGSLDLGYTSAAAGSFLASVTRHGYVRTEDGYDDAAMPPISLGYSTAATDLTVHRLSPQSRENLPGALGADPGRAWLDLDGEGLPGLLLESAGAWYYRPNLGNATLGAPRPVDALPAVADLGAGRQQLYDVDGDGRLDLVQFGRDPAGFFRRTPPELAPRGPHDAAVWDNFVPFPALPRIDWDSPALQFVDLTGDGRPDLLLTEDEASRWYPSLGTHGYGPAEPVPAAKAGAPADESAPRLVLAGRDEGVFLADMSGDGLPDLVRVRCSEVVYWPNLGYGRFGAKVVMDAAPVLDLPDRFDPLRLRLADVDGSGTTDLLYLGARETRLWPNRSGNSWGPSQTLPAMPHQADLPVGRSGVHVVDLLGNGTACLVWSSPLPADAADPVRWLDLTGGTKPHLLTSVVTNLGAETRVHYAPSTKYFLADRRAGRAWVTRLPFPVQVVARIDQFDHVTRTRFTTSYAYSHGFYDGVEREFRGFARVEQTDSESFDDYLAGVTEAGAVQDVTPEAYQPPVTIRSWFSTGAWLGGDRIAGELQQEYYQQLHDLPGPLLPEGMDERETRDCVRALKGLPLRQETYSFDAGPQAAHPYVVTENAYRVSRLQPRDGDTPAVFHVIPSETLSRSHERATADPRVEHSAVLETGPFGNPLASASITYGRASTDPDLPAAVTADQRRTYVTCGEVEYTPLIDQDTPVPAYRAPVPFESRAYEVTGVSAAAPLYTPGELRTKIAATAPIDYEILADGLTPQRRLLSRSRTQFRGNDLAPLGRGAWDTLGLTYRTYRLAFTPAVVAAHYALEVTEADWTAAGYVSLDGDGNRWIPSPTAIFPDDPAAHFYRPEGVTDALGLQTRVAYDSYGLLPQSIRTPQAPWNDVSAANDYRVLSPVMLTDVNGNRSAVAYDALGMVTRSAMMGKEGAGQGDTLDDPTVRMEYTVSRWMNERKPNFVQTLTRVRHGGANPHWQQSYTYSSGGGGVAMAKSQASPGKVRQRQPDGTVTDVDADPRWLGTARTVVNNKGNPVRQYEPFFSATHEYDGEEALRTVGSSPVVHYDPLGRVVRTDGENGTFVTTTFHPWSRRDYDANDTVRDSRWYVERGSPDPETEPEPAHDPQRRAAWLAAKHADTPAVVHLDSLGRPVYAVADRGDLTSAVRSESDLTGRYTRMFDQRDRQVAEGFASMTGIPVHVQGAEKGGRWTFVNVLGGLVRTWDDRGRTFRAVYDVLHRPVSTYAEEPDAPERLITHVVHGDRVPDAAARNLLGIAHQVFDSSGALRVDAIDFKGNPTSVVRTLARDHTQLPDWASLAAAADYAAVQTAAAALLDPEAFTAGSEYDALNRPTRLTVHGGTVMEPEYDPSNSLSRLRVQIAGTGAFVDVLKEQECDAKGQRLWVRHGNDVVVRYLYDPATFRLTDLLAVKDGNNPATQALQSLHYTYDPVGNVTGVRDDAQQTHFFANSVVAPENRYSYDALYQLVHATGREHAGLTNDAILNSPDLEPVRQLPHVNDTAAVRAYSESYEYDVLGNLRTHRHVAMVGGGSWTRRYRYAYDDNPADATNRLTATSRPGDPDAGPFTATYDYDEYGNFSRLHLPTPGELQWNVLDQLQRIDLGGGGTAYYGYGTSGRRVRKVIERPGGQRVERIYLGPLEIYRQRASGGAVRLERHTLHVGDAGGRIAQVDLKLRDEDGTDPDNPLNTPLLRYQYGNNLGSATLETDADGRVISYEEYHPYGTSAYRSGKPGTNLSLKRYRFTGKERDEETGLYCFGARYYAAWIGRWTSPDPAGFVSGANLYRYCANNPVMNHDPDGRQDTRINARADAATRRRLNHPGADPAEVLRYFQTHGHPELTDEQVPSWDAARRMWRFPDAPSPASTAEPSEEQTQPPEPAARPLPTQEAATAVREAARPRAAVTPDPVARTRVGSPRAFTPGAPMEGPYNLWSNEAGGGLKSATGAPGFIMEDTTLEEAAEATARRLGYRGRYDPTIRPNDFNEIWHPTSDALATRAGLSQLGVESHGIDPAAVARNPGYNPGRSVQVTREIPRIRAGGGAMTGLGLLSGALVLYGASQIRNSTVRGFGYVAGAGELAGAARYAQGLLMLGRMPGSAAVMSQGALLGRFAGGAGAVVLSTYSLVNHLEEGNYGVTLGDSAGIVGGVAVLAGSGPVAAVAGGVAITNVAGDWVETRVTEATGSRTAGVGAGTAAGAALGAGIGAAVGVWFFGVGAAPGAAVGAVVGGLAGFIGAYW